MKTDESQKKSGKKYLISKGIDGFFITVYNIAQFIGQFFKELVKPPYEFKEIIRQCYAVGYKSLGLITLTGLITGLVFTKQSRGPLEELGATSWLPSLVTIALIRALAPLVTSIICAGKVGSSIGAELGSMRVTEQIDAMEVSAVNPFKYLVVSRIIATTIMIPALTVYFGFLCMMGSFYNINQTDLTSFTEFIQKAFQNIGALDYSSSMIRAVVYGFTVGVVGCYQGYNTTKGTQGVGKAANMSVVISMYFIFLEEIMIVQILNWFR